MPTVGEQLRGARERAKLSVHDVANALNMRADQLRAVEESRWAEFGAPVYIRGFVRTLSKHLRLETAPMMAELEAELGRTADFAEPPSLMVRSKGPLDFLMLQLSRIRWTVALPVLLGIAVVGAVLYGLRHTEGKVTRDNGPALGSGLSTGRRIPTDLMLPLPTNTAPGRL